MKILPIGCDHAGFDLKNEIIKHLSQKGYEIKDYGCSDKESIDYPDFGHPVASYVASVNKHQGVRSALCWSKEIAELSRQHNDANIIALPARFLTTKEAIEMVDVFLTTEFEGGRHQRRVDKIACGK